MKTTGKRRKTCILLACLILPVSLAVSLAEPASGRNYEKIIKGIASDIAGLKSRYPQLADFSPEKNVNVKNLSIIYDYHTHEPAARPGWAGSVPHPDDDGIWFHIDLHDPDSMAQIHTQPRAMPLCAGGKRVTFLIMQGKDTKSISNEISSILKRRGILPCAQ